jgi:hypothetical protein
MKQLSQISAKVSRPWSRSGLFFVVGVLMATLWPVSVYADSPVLEVDVRNRRILVNPFDHEQMPLDVRAQSFERNNVMFPTLIRVPEWVPNRLGNYYLYCGSHNGHSHMYLFYSDNIEGPYTLHVQDYTDPDGNTRKISIFPMELNYMTGHATAPDVHIEEDEDGQGGRFVMYFHGDTQHGRVNDGDVYGYHHTASVAFSDDGIHWEGVDYMILPQGYARFFSANDRNYTLIRQGLVVKEYQPYMFYASSAGGPGVSHGEPGAGYGLWFLEGNVNYQFQIPILRGHVRHPGLFSWGTEELFAIYTRFQGRPERVKMIYIRDINAETAPGLNANSPMEEVYAPFGVSNQVEVIAPFYNWEGADDDVQDVRGFNQLRTPHIFADEINDKFYLLYAYRGEGGIAMAEINIFVDGREARPSGYIDEPEVLPGQFTEIIYPSMEDAVYPGQEVALVGRGLNLSWSYRVDDGPVQSIPGGSGTTASFIAPMGIELTIILEGDGGTEERTFQMGGGDPITPPEITLQPVGQTVYEGTDVTFTVEATGNPQPIYKWYKDGEPIAGATSATLVIENADDASQGDYTVRVTNAVGSFLSAIATLTVSHTIEGVDAISVNFPGNYDFPAHQLAGLLPRANWNQVRNDRTYAEGLVDNQGNTTPVNYTSTGLQYTYNRNTPSGETADHRMMSAHRGDANSPTITFENIPFNTYDVYVYWGGHYRDDLTPDFLSVQLGEQTYWLRRDNTTWSGTYVRSTAASKNEAVDSNYVLFENVSGVSFTLNMVADTANNQRRAGPSGIQIIQRDDEPPPPPPLVPAAPNSLNLLGVTHEGVSLAWIDNADDETGYRVYRASSGSGPWTQIAALPADSVTYTDETVQENTLYFYQVRAWNEHGESLPSNTVSVITPPPPSAPTITQQPQSQTVSAGQTVTFSVIAIGNPTPGYQWRKDGVDLPGETGPVLQITGVSGAAGEYDVRVFNSLGEVFSAAATLKVAPQQAGVDAISVNFAGNYAFPADQYAGLLPRSNWNQVGQSAEGLVDNKGNVTSLSYSTDLAWQYSRNEPSGESADHRMMSAHRGHSAASSTITFEDIPFGNYDVYVYWGGHYEDGLVPDHMAVSLGAETYWMRRDDTTWSGTYVRSTATTKAESVNSNYVLFEDLSAPFFTLTITPDTNNGRRRVGPTGIQIIRRVSLSAYDEWLGQYPELEESERGRLANPSGDGIPNLIKFALGLSPLENVKGPLVESFITEKGQHRHLSLSFSLRTGATGSAGQGYEKDGIRYWVEFSPDFVNWFHGEDYVEEVGSRQENGNGTETVTVRARQSMNGFARQFIRLAIEDLE